MKNITKEIKANKIGDFLEDVSLSRYTTYRIGGNASLVVYPKNELKLIKLIEILRNNKVLYKVLGNGSNVIFSDEKYDGVIIKLDHMDDLSIEKQTIKVGAGYNLIKLAYKVSKTGLTGFEFATGIPGSLGGAIYMNAGAYKSDMGYITKSVKVLTPDLKIQEILNKDMNFHYRESFLQHNKDYICLGTTIILKKGQTKNIMELIDDRKTKRLLAQPLELPSAGSVFRNPTNDFAGRLIEESGLKGYKIGGAMISLKHANFIVNYKNATAKDVRNLILYAKKEVKEKQGIDLMVEQEFVNWE